MSRGAKWVLKLMHTADVHGRMTTSKADKLSQLIEELKSDGVTEVLLLDSGDCLRGSNTILLPRERVMRLMNQLGYTAMAVGNREFHYLFPLFTWRASGFQFQLLSANLIPPRETRLLSPLLNLRIRGLKIAITGFTPPQYPEGAIWEKVFGWRFIPPDKALTQLLRKLKITSTPNLLIVLSHLGIEEDLRLAELLAEESELTSLILGGHSHVEEIIKDPLLIVHTPPYLQRISVITLLIREGEHIEVAKVERVNL